MRSLRGTVMAIGAALGAATLGGLVAVGCSSNGSSPAEQSDSGTDASSDSPSDVTLDTAQDVQGDDAQDSSTVVESGPGVDSGVVDSGKSVDSGNADASDAEPPGLVFAKAEATAYCTALLNCCPGGLDSGAYPGFGTCVGVATVHGWEQTLPSDTSVYSRGNITVDTTKATQCLAQLNSFPCGTQTGAQWALITQACELVIQGTIPANQTGCISSWECAPGNYCDTTVTGGKCTPLATKGQRCNTVINSNDNPLPDQMCSYLASGQPALFCDLINNAPDAATCQPLLTAGANCENGTDPSSSPWFEYYDDQACPLSAPLCGDNLQCGGTASYPYSNFCQAYAAPIVDAGGGG
jgi:hypothetical protein